ncbi:MAG: D-alanyl-D-alanine carboxypeptidase family protein [Erysipelotrichaceae bacterium]
MAKKKRKLNVINLLILLSLCACISLGFIIFTYKTKTVNINPDDLNNIDYSQMEKLDLDLSSDKYLLIRLNDFKVLYGDKTDERFYPASLTKVVTMDALLHNVEDVNSTSSYSSAQYNELIAQNASIAGLSVNREYSLEELLYALILPSGADAALALENYCDGNNINLIDEMNKLSKELELKDSSFVNTTGLHDDNLYTTMEDYTSLIIDTLKYDTGKKVLKTLVHYGESGTYQSSLYALYHNGYVDVLGGKTGFTYEAGLNLAVLYQVNNRSYLLLLANADGEYYMHNNINDALKIFEYLYGE